MLKLNETTLYLGEALQTLMKMESESVDGILTDPPYSTGGTYTAQRQRPPTEKYQNSASQKRQISFTDDNRD